MVTRAASCETAFFSPSSGKNYQQWWAMDRLQAMRVHARGGVGEFYEGGVCCSSSNRVTERDADARRDSMSSEADGSRMTPSAA